MDDEKSFFIKPKMSRRKKIFKKEIKQDPVYNSILVSMLINRILLKGKKTLAQHILYGALKDIQETTKGDPLEVLKKAITNATPTVELKSRRIGGATYQVPIEIKEERGTSLAIKFIVQASRNKAGKSMINKLRNEIIEASNNTGSAVKKKEEIHKMSEANKAFATIRF